MYLNTSSCRAPLAVVAHHPWAEFDRALARLFSPLSPALGVARHSPRAHLKEAETAYTLTVELPGVKRENAALEWQDAGLTLVLRTDATNSGEASSAAEARYTFRLPEDVEPAQAKARLADGLLTVELPKPAPAPAQKIVIE